MNGLSGLDLCLVLLYLGDGKGKTTAARRWNGVCDGAFFHNKTKL